MPAHHDSTSSTASRHAQTSRRNTATVILAWAVVTTSACSGFCENQRPNPPRQQAAAQTRQRAPSGTTTDASAVAARDGGSALHRYSLDQAALNATLPAALHEVSGLTPISGSEVACIQDEDGIIFVYDLEQQKITRQVRFGPAGDYEGIARVDARYYVLRSDGTLYEIDGLHDQPAVRSHALKLPTSNNEGLCHDPSERRLLVAPKSRMGKGKEFKDARPLYAFDLESSELVSDPVMMIGVDSIYEFAEAHGLPVPEKQKKKGGRARPMLRFMPSSVAVHPITKEIFILSAMDHVLATFDREANVTGYAVLESSVFPQPEGITFLDNGDMLVTNEAAGHQPTLLRFQYNDAQP